MFWIEVWSHIYISSFEGNWRKIFYCLTEIRLNVLLRRFWCQLFLVQGLSRMLSLNMKSLSSCKFHLIQEMFTKLFDNLFLCRTLRRLDPIRSLYFHCVFRLCNDKIDLVIAFLSNCIYYWWTVTLWMEIFRDWIATVNTWLLRQNLVLVNFKVSWFNWRYRFCKIIFWKLSSLRLLYLITAIYRLVFKAC